MGYTPLHGVYSVPPVCGPDSPILGTIYTNHGPNSTNNYWALQHTGTKTRADNQLSPKLVQKLSLSISLQAWEGTSYSSSAGKSWKDEQIKISLK